MGVRLAGPGERVTEVDQIIGDDAQTDAALHAWHAAVTKSIKAVATSYQQPDSSLAPSTDHFYAGE
jgi:hypothetical protein